MLDGIVHGSVDVLFVLLTVFQARSSRPSMDVTELEWPGTRPSDQHYVGRDALMTRRSCDVASSSADASLESGRFPNTVLLSA